VFNNGLDRRLTHYNFPEHEREVEEEEISQAQTQTQKDEGPFQYDFIPSLASTKFLTTAAE